MNIFKWTSSCAGADPLSRPQRSDADGPGSRYDQRDTEDAGDWPHVARF